MNLPTSKHVVLLAEDDEAIARTWTEALRLNGFKVVWAAAGESALALAKTARPDLLLTDWLLPEIDGMTLRRLFREDPALIHVPIILALASPLALPDESASALQTVYLRKPVDVSLLCATVSALLGKASEAGKPPAVDDSAGKRWP
ncbi:response regulator [Paraburkholderia sp. CNPSo 3157]|uniref:Response regulator n=1 Tax=Paraburkholderia franconis TaxID=2654983 RepID=A0A7X1TI14_9BURK|nr:response regulator [Paraburkholderia franconis]MPW19993.1 response regulator [Paraburkholderia franconis]